MPPWPPKPGEAIPIPWPLLQGARVVRDVREGLHQRLREEAFVLVHHTGCPRSSRRGTFARGRGAVLLDDIVSQGVVGEVAWFVLWKS